MQCFGSVQFIMDPYLNPGFFCNTDPVLDPDPGKGIFSKAVTKMQKEIFVFN